MTKVSLIFGTRPEAIKLCPLILAIKQHPDFKLNVCVTAQHRQMLDQVLEVFGVKPDVDMDIMKPNQRLASLTSKAIENLDAYMTEQKPDIVLVQGDTTTAFCAALVAFYHRIPLGHVEAGLRTWDKFLPYPEEVNRVLTTRLADYHFAPTEWARKSLLQEGVARDRIYVTGNTVIDALKMTLDKLRDRKKQKNLEHVFKNNYGITFGNRKLILVTGHRRESFGADLEKICRGLKRIAQDNSDLILVYPVHLNPNVQKPVREILSKIDNIYQIEPLDYLTFVWLMSKVYIILTDSGGIQEEAAYLGKPLLVMRKKTERPEGVEIGTAKLVGTDEDRIYSETMRLIEDRYLYQRMKKAANPYGDGTAAKGIVDILLHNGLKG